MTTFKIKQFFSGLLFLIAGLILLYLSIDPIYGSSFANAITFFPILVSLFLIGVGILIFVEMIFSNGKS